MKVLKVQENWCEELLVLLFPCESFLLAREFHVQVISLLFVPLKRYGCVVLFVPLKRYGYVVRFPALRGLGCAPGNVV